MGYKHDRESLLAAALEFVEAEGLSSLSFGRLAKQLGIADRTIVYYFPTKDQLVTEVLVAVSGRLLLQMAQAFGDRPRSRLELLKRSWPLLTSPETQSTFRIFIELSGMAANGVEPYAGLTAKLMRGWHEWLMTLIDAPTLPRRRSEAAALITQVDGLMMMRIVAGEDLATLAYQTMIKK